MCGIVKKMHGETHPRKKSLAFENVPPIISSQHGLVHCTICSALLLSQKISTCYTVTRRIVKFRYIHMMTQDDNGSVRENIFVRERDKYMPCPGSFSHFRNFPAIYCMKIK